MSATELRSLTEPQSLYVMPSWTTGGTDVICERETDKAGERERERDRGKERGGDRGREREAEREGEEEICNEARLQG